VVSDGLAGGMGTRRAGGGGGIRGPGTAVRYLVVAQGMLAGRLSRGVGLIRRLKSDTPACRQTEKELVALSTCLLVHRRARKQLRKDAIDMIPRSSSASQKACKANRERRGCGPIEGRGRH